MIDCFVSFNHKHLQSFCLLSDLSLSIISLNVDSVSMSNFQCMFMSPINFNVCPFATKHPEMRTIGF